MDSLYILIPIALVFSAIAIKAFFWAVDNNQYDDLDAAGYSILFDEDINGAVKLEGSVDKTTGDKAIAGKITAENTTAVSVEDDQ